MQEQILFGFFKVEHALFFTLLVSFCLSAKLAKYTGFSVLTSMHFIILCEEELK